METSSDLHPWFVTGFVEGEGTFTFSRHREGSLSLYFGVKLTEIDRPILEALQAFFGGAGKLYYVQPRAALTPNSGYTKAASYYRISKAQDLVRVVRHFDSFPLRGCKRTSYAIWREMVMLKTTTGISSRLLEPFARELSAASVRNRRWSAQGLHEPRKQGSQIPIGVGGHEGDPQP
jgi:LAGLIDADG DNA endonuclease family protein